jgi:hypothetical protein
MSEESQSCNTCPDGKVRNKAGKCVMPEVTFSSFILSLNTSALFHLGELVHPETGEKVLDLDLAKHSINILDLLRKKTVGNLDKDEEQLLSNILYELKVRYVKLSK